MHRLKSNWGRSLPAVAIALAVAATLAAIVAVNLGSGTSSVVTASNLTPTAIHSATELQKFTGVSCADIYLDGVPAGNPLNPVGTAPGAEDQLVASALSRTEPSALSGKLDVTTVSYQGPDLIIGDEDFVLDAVPDTGPTVNTCDISRTNGQTGKEHEGMHQRTAFANQFGNRPTAHANLIVGTYDPTNTEDGIVLPTPTAKPAPTPVGATPFSCSDGKDNVVGPEGLQDWMDPDCYDAGTTSYITFTTCIFSEVLSVWQRTDSINVITDKATKATNYGRVVLYVRAGIPTSGPAPGKAREALVPTSCATAGSLPFASVTVVRPRVATTDKPALDTNPAAIAAGKLAVDADGCNPDNGSVLNKPTPTPTRSAVCNPKPKDGQDKDGWNEQYSTYVADDWDGDGCPDWDELDNAFVHSFTTPNSADQNGMDPYNPNDCDKNFNGNIALLVTVIHDSSVCNLVQLVTPGACAPGGTPGSPNGQYFFCLTKVTHTKGPDVSGDPGLQEAVDWVAGCYSDSSVTAVNAQYFAEAGASCSNNTDQDADGFINDGCPGGPAETVCTGNADEDGDNKVNDGCPVSSGSETGGQCANNTDDDGDLLVNDGCPAVPSESQQCKNNSDDDLPLDGVVNDGCPQVGTGSESGGQCANDTNDDPGDDGAVNDGCSPNGAAELDECNAGDTADDDGDGKVNDGCGSKPDQCAGAAPLAAQDYCGDGRAGPRPPGGSIPNSNQAFTAISDQSFPVPFSGVYDHTDNRIKFDFCLIGFGGDIFGPNVHSVGNIDAHTGAGTMDLYGNLTTPDCSGTPVLTFLGKEVLMVERGRNIDSDHDGCTDDAELQWDATLGGRRDPFSKWDYFNPALNNINRTADITAVVQKYGFDDGVSTLYKQRYDRSGSVPGSHSWNALPPNGQIRTADITAAVNAYGHDCPAKLPPPYTYQ